MAAEIARYIGFGPTSTGSPSSVVPSAATSSGRMPRAADPRVPSVDAPTQNLVVSACATSPSPPAAGPRSPAHRAPLNTLSRAGRLVRSASVAQWKSSSVLRKGLGVRVPPGAPSSSAASCAGPLGGSCHVLDPPSMKGREQCETKSKAASCALPLSVQAVGGSSTRASSREDRTRSSARSWAGTRPGPQRALPRSAVPPTRTSTRCSTPSVQTWSPSACRTRGTSNRPSTCFAAESRCSWRSRWSSTSTRRMRCCVKPTSAGSSSRSTSTIDSRRRSPGRRPRSTPARSGGPFSRPGDSGARRTTVRPPTRTSSRPSATASTCSSTWWDRSRRSART